MFTAAGAAAVWQALHWSSPLVRGWRPSSFDRERAGVLSVLDSGPSRDGADPALVLLHGLGATGDYFGGLYDGASPRRRVVIVDLLGFGHSLDEDRSSFGLEDHVRALDDALRALGLGDSSLTVAAHSMGSAVALMWARQNPDRAERVVLWGPPIFRDGGAADEIGREYGPMARLLMADSPWAEKACMVNCWNRGLSGAAMAALAPRWPFRVVERSSRHTWDAYRESLSSLVLDVDWAALLPAKAPLTVFRGGEDPIGDPGLIGELIGAGEIVEIPGGDHHLAIRRPDLLLDLLRQS